MHPLPRQTRPLRITVTDVDDCVPQFLKREYSKKIPENIKTGELVLTVSASDEDLGTNGEVTYSFSSGKDQEVFLSIILMVRSK